MRRHQPGERAGVVAPGDGLVDGRRPGPADVGVEGDDRVDRRVDGRDPLQVGVEQLARGHLPGGEQAALLGRRQFHHGVPHGRPTYDVPPMARTTVATSLVGVTVVRVALAQLNPTVGDLDGNLAKLVDAYDRAEEAGCDIVAFPELSITGYPPEDLVMKPGFVADNEAALAKLAARTRHCTAVVGFVDEDRDLFNAAAVCAQGEVLGTYRKRLLPNYAVFDEARYFTPGNETDPLELYVIGGVKVGISICEDIWSPDGPLAVQADGGAELAININASPYHRGKAAYRERMLATRAADSHSALVYVNQVGGQDELVFDGCSLAFDAEGDAARPRPAVPRGAADRRRPRPGRVPPAPARPARPHLAGRRCRPSSSPRRRSPTRRRSTTRSSSRCRRRPSCTRRSCSAPATTAPRTASPTSSSGCPAASTRRSSP